MVIKVGINGFGRIGRIIFRTCFQNPELELSAINDPAIDIEYICYLIKFDSTHGKFRKNITHADNEIIIGDQKIKIFREKLPPDVPWYIAGVQYVVESSGMFTCLNKASGHLASEGVRRVIVTAPSVDVPMIILGVNENELSTEQKVLSCTSSTLYCLAPVIKVLNDHFGVAEGFITSIHAMTPSLKPLDGLCLRGKIDDLANQHVTFNIQALWVRYGQWFSLIHEFRFMNATRGGDSARYVGLSGWYIDKSLAEFLSTGIIDGGLEIFA